jgi:hypothetical protein
LRGFVQLIPFCTSNIAVTATAAATAYAAFVGDGDPVDGLETIGQGNDPLTKVIGQGAQAAIELSYELLLSAKLPSP